LYSWLNKLIDFYASTDISPLHSRGLREPLAIIVLSLCHARGGCRKLHDIQIVLTFPIVVLHPGMLIGFPSFLYSQSSQCSISSI